ncbi:MAG: hypothetical protein FWE38_03990 [Firmicutes bacterium]|nr:hypothetical protein [Bacillota bacterium]
MDRNNIDYYLGMYGIRETGNDADDMRAIMGAAGDPGVLNEMSAGLVNMGAARDVADLPNDSENWNLMLNGLSEKALPMVPTLATAVEADYIAKSNKLDGVYMASRNIADAAADATLAQVHDFATSEAVYFGRMRGDGDLAPAAPIFGNDAGVAARVQTNLVAADRASGLMGEIENTPVKNGVYEGVSKLKASDMSHEFRKDAMFAHQLEAENYAQQKDVMGTINQYIAENVKKDTTNRN